MRFLICILICAIQFLGCSKEPGSKVCINRACVQVEIADSPQKRGQGLMFRERLSPNKGMLFIFDAEARYAFWMKNMKFPIDIIWIDHDKKIVDIKKMVSPCQDKCESLMPQTPAQYVLEVPSGFAQKNKIAIGDIATF